MRTLGLLGGLSWHSTALYYEHLNRGVAARLGPFRSADLILRSVDYGAVRQARQDGDWRRLERRLIGACRGLKRAGAEGLVLCSNTIHRFAPAIEAQTGLPVLHVADAAVARAQELGARRVGLLATAYTTRERFYRERLEAGGLQVQVCEPATVARLDAILLEEVARGELRADSRAAFVEAIGALRASGAEAVILGCTEIGLLVGEGPLELPTIETVAVHAAHALDWALGGPPGADPPPRGGC